MSIKVVTIALIVGLLAKLYQIALRGNHPSLTKHLRGLNPSRTESRPIRILLFVVANGAALYAIFVFNGMFVPPAGTIRWWMVVAVATFAIALVTDGLLG